MQHNSEIGLDRSVHQPCKAAGLSFCGVAISLAREQIHASRWRRILASPLLLLSLSLLLRAVTIVAEPVINPDAVRYLNAAREIQAQHFQIGFTHNGEIFFYPTLLAALHLCIPDWVLVGQLISALATSFAVLPLYLIASRLFGRRAAFWAGLAFVLSPEVNDNASKIVRDPLFLCLFLLAVFFALELLHRFAWWRLGVVLGCIGCALLLRVEAVLFLPVFILALLLRGWRQGDRGGFLQCLAGILLPALVVLGAVLFWPEIDNHLAKNTGYGAFATHILQQNPWGTYPEIYSALKEWERGLPNAQWSTDVAEIVRQNLPLIYLLGLVERYCATAFLPFVLLAFFALLRPAVRQTGGGFCLGLLAVFLLGAYFSLIHRNFLSGRYLLVPAVLLLPWTGAGLATLIHAARKTSLRSFAPACVVLVFAVPLWATACDWARPGKAIREAGSWLAAQEEFAQAALLCNEERIPFYAGRWRGEYEVALDDGFLEKAARERSVELLAMQMSTRKGAAVPVFAGLTPIQTFADEKNLVIIYQREP